MLTSSDIEKRAKMSNADCIITDISTAMKIEDGGGTNLTKKLFVVSYNSDESERGYMEKMESKGKSLVYYNL